MNISKTNSNNNLNPLQTTDSSLLKQQVSQNFELLLTELLFSSTQQTGVSGAEETSSSNLFSLKLLALIQQFLSGPTPPLAPQTEWTYTNPQNIQINQFEAETLVGGDGRNANCGPTSLAMGLHVLGFSVKGETAGMNNGQIVDLARLCMIYEPGKDGVDSLGKRMEAEHNTYTNLNDVIHGAQISGAQASAISSDSSSIQNALQNHSVVVISGTFAGKFPPPWTGDRGHDNLGAPGNATAHIVAITGYNSSTNKFIVNDPARKTPLEVDSATLQYFLKGNSGAVAISR